MDDYFSSGGDDFSAFAGDDAGQPFPPAAGGAEAAAGGLHQAIPPNQHADIAPPHQAGEEAAVMAEVPMAFADVAGASGSTDYFGSVALAADDPFAAIVSPAPAHPEGAAESDRPSGMETMTEEPIQDVDIHASTDVASPTHAAVAPAHVAVAQSTVDSTTPVVQSPAHATTSSVAPHDAAVATAAPTPAVVPAPAASSVSSYFGGSSELDDAFGDVSLAGNSVSEATAPIVPGDSASVSSYFGGSDADDPLQLGGSSQPPVVGVAQEPSASLDYFNQAAADDWMNPQPTHQTTPAANQFFDSFSTQHPPPPAQMVSFPPPQQPQQAPVATRPDQHSHAPGAPGGPQINLSQSNTPAPHAAVAPSQPPAPSSSSDDYFGGQSSGADDWLAVAAPPATQAPMHMPTSQPHAMPLQTMQPHQPPYGAHPYGVPTQSQVPPPHPATATHSHHHLQPPVPLDRQISQLAEVDLNSPARPMPLAHSASDLADVPLSTPTAMAQFPPPQQQQPPPAEAPRTHGAPFMPGVPTMPGVLNPYAAAASPSAPKPMPSPYGAGPAASTGEAAPFRPMAIPSPSAAPMMESGARAPFVPRADPLMAAQQSQASPMQQAAPWQPQQQSPHPNGHAPPHMQPQQLQHPQQAYTAPHQPYGSQPSPSNGTPQHGGGFGTPGLFASPASPLGGPTRAWTPLPAHPLVCFGFGGRMLTMLPRAAHGGGLRAGLIQLESLAELLESQPFVAKLTAFPGPLTLPAGQPGTRHPRHVELEDMVQVAADQAMYAPLPSDSPLAALAQSDPTKQAEVLANHRAAKRLLHLLLLESLRHSGRIHRASNPTSMHTLPAPPAGGQGGVEEAMVHYLVQLDGAAGGAVARKDGQWLDNAASSHLGVGDGVVPTPVMSVSSAAVDSSQQDGVVVAMQSLLLKGQRKEACHLAIEHHLWSHALLLASFDMATYHMVVGRFATQQFADGSPLQSLYLLFAQQPNLLFRGVAGPDGKGMDGVVIPGPHTPLFTVPNTPPLLKNWRANLSMLLANPTPNDKQVLTTLGDTLWQNYHLPSAAHMVYVLAGHSLGPDLRGSSLQHAQPLGRILLLGADHRKHMRTFVTPGALQRTEIFEYTRQLAATAGPSGAAGSSASTAPILPYGGLSPAFQLFKLLYAYQLAEVGLMPRALQYCEQLSNTVAQHGKTGKGSLVFPPVFLTALVELEARLRECLSKKAGPGLASKIGGKLLGWLVGDSAQAPGATTVVGPDPSLAPASQQTNMARSVSTNNLPHQKITHSPMANGNAHQQHTPMHNSASELNLNQHHHAGAPSADYSGNYNNNSNMLSPAAVASSTNSLAIQSPPKHSRTRTEPAPESAASKAATPAAAAEDATPGGTKKAGLFGKITSLWGGGSDGKKKPVKAHLRQENTFEYDDASGKWVQRDAKGNIVVDEEEEKPVAPPTISDEMKARLSAPPMLPPSIATGGGGAGPGAAGPAMPGLPGMPPPSMFAQRGAAGAKGRYALADNSFEDASASITAAPVAAPMPSMFPTSPAAGFPAPMPGGGAPGGSPTFKLFRPSAAAAPMPGGDGSSAPAPLTSPYAAAPPQQHLPNGQPPAAVSPYGAPQPQMGRANTPPQARPGEMQPPQAQFGSPYGHPQQSLPGYHQQPPSAGGYHHPQQASLAPQHGWEDGRAQSTPPMRPGTVPAGAPSMAYNPHGAPTNPMMMRYQPQAIMPQPGASPSNAMPPPQAIAPYMPPQGGYRPPPAHY